MSGHICDSKIVIWGSNQKNCFVDFFLDRFYENIMYFVDNDIAMQGTEIKGKRVYPPPCIKARNP